MFTLRLGLARVPASLDDVLGEIGTHLDAYQPSLTQHETDLELSLTVQAADLWLAILMAMTAVTGLGYPIARLDARPV